MLLVKIILRNTVSLKHLQIYLAQPLTHPQLFSQGGKQVVWNCTWFSRTPSSRHVRRPRQDFICFSTDIFFETLIPPVISTLAAVQRPTHAAPRRRFTACAGATAASHMRRCRRDEAVPSCVGGVQRQLILLFLRSWFLSSSFSFASLPGFQTELIKGCVGGSEHNRSALFLCCLKVSS